MKSGEGAKSRTPLVCPHFAAWHCDVRVSQRRTHPSIDVLRREKKRNVEMMRCESAVVSRARLGCARS